MLRQCLGVSAVAPACRFGVAAFLFGFLRFFSAFPLYKGIRKNPAALLPIKESIWQQDCRRIFIINANARPLSIGAGLSGLEISKNRYVFLILSDLES